MTFRFNSLLMFCFCLFLILEACTYRKDVYHMSRLVSSNDWKHTDTLSWTIDDTLINTGKYDIHLEIRNDIRYPYENIGLEVTILSSDSTVQTKDTVNYRLADKNGHWTGSGWGSLYQSEFLFLSGTQLQDSAV